MTDTALWNPPEAQPYFEQYAAEVDTPAARVRLARLMADAAMDGLTLHVGSASLALDAAILGWLDRQEGDVVVGWLAEMDLVESYEMWAEPDPPSEPEDEREARLA